MKKVLLFSILALLSTAIQAQYISCYGAKNKSTQSIDKYVIITNCNLYFAQKTARDSLIKLGYKEDSYTLTSIGYKEAYTGMYALIKYAGKDNYNKVKTVYGFGAGETEDEALKKAQENLAINNWGWTQNLGYDRVESKSFFTCEVNLVAYQVKMEKSGSCGSSIQNKSFLIKKASAATDIPKAPMQYFIIPKNKPFVAAIEIEYLCAPENTKYSEVKLLSAGSKDELATQIVNQLILPKYENLSNVYVLFMSNAGTNVGSNSGILSDVSKAVDQLLNQKIIETEADYCRKFPGQCQNGKRIRRTACMCIRG